MGNLLLGDAALGGLVVLVGTLDGAVYANEAGAYAAGIGQHFVQTHLVSGDPAAVQPEDIQLAVSASGELAKLILGKVHIVLPPVGVLLYVIVDAAARGGVVGIPEPLTVPVGLGEIGANPEVLAPEGVKDVAGCIGPGVAGKGTCLGNGEVRII